MRSTLVISTLSAALLLAGCGGDEETPEEPTATQQSGEEATDEGSADAAGDPTEDEADETTAEETDETTEEETDETADDTASGEAAFGTRLQVSDNLTLTISEPEEFTPSYPELAMEEWDTFIKMDVVAENTGDEPFEAFGINARATTGSREAEAIFDIDNGIDLPTAVIQPGRELEFSMGFGVMSGEPFDLTVEDMMDFTGEGVTISTTIE